MPAKKYISRIDKPVVHITASGAMYVRPFDIIRSESGRAIIHRHAAEERIQLKKQPQASSKTEEGENSTSKGK